MLAGNLAKEDGVVKLPEQKKPDKASGKAIAEGSRGKRHTLSGKSAIRFMEPTSQ